MNKAYSYLLLPLLLSLGLLTQAHAQDATLSGTVTDHNTGEALPGASVLLEELGTGDATNAEGQFTIEGIEPGTYTVLVNFVGYRTGQETVELSAGEQAELNIRLRADVLGLDQVVVTARGATSARREIGTSVTSIDTEGLEAAPITSMSQMLQGRTPGMNVQFGGGKSGQHHTIVLRGAASISQSNEPVIYVDGVRIDNSRALGISTVTSGVTTSGLDDINPEDIERVEIVRGASAATLYGTEASAGVIQIFTKRGQEGTPQFTFRSQAGINQTPRDWWGVSAYSDWFYDEMVQTGGLHNQYLSVSGGLENVQYYASGNLRGDTGVLPNSNESYGSARLNLDIQARDDLSLRLNAAYSDRSVQHVPDANNTRGYTINGLVGGPQGQFGTPTLDHTAIEAFQNNNRFTGSIGLDHQAHELFSQRVTIGYETRDDDQFQFFPFGAINNLADGFRSNYRRNATNFNVDYIGTLRAQLTDDVRSTTSAGFQYYNTVTGSSSAIGNDFPMIGLSTVSATVDQSAAESRFRERSAGFFVEQQFGLADMFFVTLGARADGHSAFGEDVEYQLYPKIDMSYILSEHAFWNDDWGTLRLRGAYGTAGQQPGAFDAVRTWLPTSAVGAQPAVRPGNVGNPDLRAEVTHEFEAGFELSTLNDRLMLDFTAYHQRTEDALYQFRYPPSTGARITQLENVGEIQNQGLELAVNVVPVATSNFRWDANISFSTNRNEVTDLGGGAPIQVQWRQFIREGYPVGAMFGDRYIEHNGEVGLASELLADADGNLPDDWDYIGPGLPTRTAQLGSNFNIGGNIDIGILFDHRGGGHIHSSTLRWLWDPRRVVPEDGQGVTTAGPAGLACREPANEIIAANCARNSDLSQGDFVFPSDFVKLRELSVSYRLPTNVIEPLGITSARVTVSGRNLWRWQEYDGLEAEANYRGEFGDSAIRQMIFFDTPIPRQIIGGISLQF